MTGDAVRRADLPTPAGLPGRPVYPDYNATTPVDPSVSRRCCRISTNPAKPQPDHPELATPEGTVPKKCVKT